MTVSRRPVLKYLAFDSINIVVFPLFVKEMRVILLIEITRFHFRQWIKTCPKIIALINTGLGGILQINVTAVTLASMVNTKRKTL